MEADLASGGSIAELIGKKRLVARGSKPEVRTHLKIVYVLLIKIGAGK